MNFQDFSKQASSSLLWTGILFVIIGIMGLWQPAFLAIYIVYMIAFFFLFAGCESLYRGFKFSSVKGYHYGLAIFTGLIEVLLAIALIAFPMASEFAIFIYIGVFLVIKGIFVIINVLTHKKAFPALFNCSLGGGIIDLLFGIVLLVMPFFSNLFLIYVLAWYFLFCGINFIVNSITLKNDAKNDTTA